MSERHEYKCPKCGSTMSAIVEFSIPRGRESTRDETLSAVIGTLRQVVKALPEQSVPNAKVQAAIQLLEALP